MGLTSFPGGLTSMCVPVIGSQGFMTQGNSFFVNPNGGADGNTGKVANKPLDTVSAALGKCTADQNDVVYFMSGGNASAECTDYQTANLDWNKDITHLIGINSGSLMSQRSRIAWASTASATSDTVLFTVSANGCKFENMQWYCGIDDANLSFNVNVTGSRNHFVNCHFGGIGHATNDAAGAYSLLVQGSENVFDSCVIGIDTIARGTAANSEILLSGGATYGGARNVFRNCYIITYAEAATHQFVSKAASGIDRFVLFDNCVFINSILSGGSTMSEAIDVTAGGSPNGFLVFKDCAFFGVTDIEAAAVSGEVYLLGHTAVAGDNSLGAVTAAS